MNINAESTGSIYTVPSFGREMDRSPVQPKGERSTGLMKATLRCRLCARPVGDVVNYRGQTLVHARFIPIYGGVVPQVKEGKLRCGRCGGQLQLDDVEPLGRGVQWSEVGGIPFTAVARIVRKQNRSLAA